MDIDGSTEVLQLIAAELPDLEFFPLPVIRWLTIRGSEDLMLNATLPSPELKYAAHWRFPYQFPHVLISARQGRIEGVLCNDEKISVIDANKERSLVRMRPYTHDTPLRRDTHRRAYYEAILEIKYT